MIYGILDKQTGEFRYVAAGHLGPIHFPRHRASSIGETGGIPVGLLESATYEEHVVRLSPGDRLYFCTDGILEAENAADQEFGVKRLLGALDKIQDCDLGEGLSFVMHQVEEWSAPAGPADDASLLAIEHS